MKSSMLRSERINQSYGGYVVSLTIVTLLPASNLVTNANETNTVDRYTKEQKRLNEPELLWYKRSKNALLVIISDFKKAKTETDPAKLCFNKMTGVPRHRKHFRVTPAC